MNNRGMARQIVGILGDRRLLCEEFRWEIEQPCCESANLVRPQVNEVPNRPEVEPQLAGRIRAMRLAFRRIVDGVVGVPWHRHARRLILRQWRLVR